MEQQSFGYWLKLKRKALDLTREELAEQVGYSAATIRKIEDEERHPSAQVVERLADVFDIPPDERIAFLRFARGDLKSTPTSRVENVPWLVSDIHEPETAGSKTHLATFLFTDIEDSAKLWERTPEQMKVALQRHNAMLHEAITSNGGTVFQIVGDAFCAVFTTVPAAISAALTVFSSLHWLRSEIPVWLHPLSFKRLVLRKQNPSQLLNASKRVLRINRCCSCWITLSTLSKA